MTRLWCVAMLALATIGSSQLATAVVPSVDSGTPELDEAIALLQRLDGALLSADYDNLPLIEVAADLEGRLPAKLRIDWDGLSMAGIQPGTPVTLHVAASSCTTALRGLAMMLGRDSSRAVVDVYGGQIVLTSSRGAAQLRFTAVYDLRDLLTRAEVTEMLGGAAPEPQPDRGAAMAQPKQPHAGPDARKAGEAEPEPPPNVAPAPNEAPHEAPNEGPNARPAVDPPGRANEPDQQRPGQRQRNRGGRNVALERQREMLERLPPPPPAAPGERLVMLLTDHVDPEAWINFGGDRAEYSEREGRVIVTAPASTHRRLAAVLAQLRAAEPSGVTVEAAIIEVPRATLARLSAIHGPTDAAFARLLRAAADASVLWQTTGTAVIDQALTVESTVAPHPGADSDAATVHFSMTPSRLSEPSRLVIRVRAEMRGGDDRRMIETTAAVPPLPATTALVVELASAKAASLAADARPAPARLLVVMPRRF